MRTAEKKNPDDGCFLCGYKGEPGGSPEGSYDGFEIEGRIYGIRFCADCGVGWTSPFLDERELKKRYSSTYRADDSTRFFAPVEKVIGLLRVKRCKRVESFSKKGRILDVGCGRADFLALMSGRGWQCTGLELDERIEAHGKRIGLDLRAGAVGEAGFEDGYFDCVTFWHVFEHIGRPEEALKECRRILKPGGLLVIAVPNTGSIQAKVSGRHWFHLDPPYHLYHYSPANLGRLLEKNGFSISGVRHFSFEYNPYGYIQSIFNICGFRTNLLYDFLRSKARFRGHCISLLLMFLSMPVVVPLSVLLSIIEAASGRGGTIEVYAMKNDR